jgi:hypothetical protein
VAKQRSVRWLGVSLSLQICFVSFVPLVMGSAGVMDATKITTAADERTRRVSLYVREDCLGLRSSVIQERERFVGIGSKAILWNGQGIGSAK